MSELNELNIQAFSAYNSGNFRLSSLIYRQAADLARALEDTDQWFIHTHWAAESEFARGNYSEAQRLAFMCAATPSATSALGVASLPYRIKLQYRPERAALQAMLQELEDQTAHLTQGPQDAFVHRLLLYQETGNLDAAIEAGELAFLKHQPGGYAKEDIARCCIDACVLAGRLHDAESWLEVIKRMLHENKSKDISANYAAASLTIALAQNQKVSTLLGHLSALEDAAYANDSAYVQRVLHAGRIRVALLDPSSGDPAKSWHPARNECRSPPPTPQNIHYRFQHHLLVLDYRLACVEFFCGLTCEDQPLEANPKTPGADLSPGIGPRVARARSALKVAFRKARQLDDMLECEWRTEEVSLRAQRLEALEARLIA